MSGTPEGPDRGVVPCDGGDGVRRLWALVCALDRQIARFEARTQERIENADDSEWVWPFVSRE